MGAVKERFGLVTGASGGIGQEIVRVLEESGVAVLQADIDIEGVDVARRLLPLDVTAPDSWCFVEEQIRKHFGSRLDILVNNAGILTMGTLTDVSPASWERTLSVNLTGAFLGMRQLVPLLIESRGCIVNVSSIVGLKGNANMVAYAASKAGLLGLTYAAARDLAPFNVRVNAVCPGTVETEMAAGFFQHGIAGDEAREASVRKHPLGRLGLPYDVAAAVRYLAGTDASFITGIALPVDGGRSIA
jgi:NAD(P)-dependent dehydrogenase (short-subunit alcohol dehydrogenase family)